MILRTLVVTYMARGASLRYPGCAEVGNYFELERLGGSPDWEKIWFGLAGGCRYFRVGMGKWESWNVLESAKEVSDIFGRQGFHIIQLFM